MKYIINDSRTFPIPRESEETIIECCRIGLIYTYREYLQTFTKESLIDAILDDTWFEDDYYEYIDRRFDLLLSTKLITRE